MNIVNKHMNKLFLSAFLLGFSLLTNAQSSPNAKFIWNYLLDNNVNGVVNRFDVNEASLEKKNELILFEMRNFVKEENQTNLIDFVASNIFGKSAGFQTAFIVKYGINCSNRQFTNFYVKTVDSSERIIKESAVTGDIVALANMKPIPKNTPIFFAANRYCNYENYLTNRGSSSSDITTKSILDQSNWSLVRSNLNYPNNADLKFDYFFDQNSVKRINSTTLKYSARAYLSKNSDVPTLSNVFIRNTRYILNTTLIDCEKKQFGNEITEYYDEQAKILSRYGGVGAEYPLNQITANANVDLIFNIYCPRLAELPIINYISSTAQINSFPLSTQVTSNQIAPVVSKLQKRIALVIGNSDYKIRPLVNPKNDANDVANALRIAGFEVLNVRDGTLAQMRNAVREFGDKLLTSDVGLVYYSGHGVEVRGQNFFIPVNADIKRADEISDQALSMNLILEKMETAQKGVNILIVDACRDDPFGRSFRSSTRGLAQVDAPKGTIIAFATSPGRVADDGEGKNSPYTRNLVKAMQEPNLPIEQVFKQVRRAVQQETKNQQTPWENTSLSGDFFFIIKK